MTTNQDDPSSTAAPTRGSGGGAPSDPDRRDPAAIALRMEDLTLWAIERAAGFPRDHKFTVGDRLIDSCLDVTTALVEATYLPRSRAKLHHLHQASRALTRARVLVRVAQRLHLLSARQRQYFATQSDELGRMLGGWTRSMQHVQASHA